MKRLILVSVCLCVAIVAFLFGTGVHTSQHRTLVSRELQSLAAITEALQALESQDPRTAAQVLEDRMRRSLADLTDLTQVRAPLDEPDLGRAVTDAEGYARRHKMDEAGAQAREIGTRLRQR